MDWEEGNRIAEEVVGRFPGSSAELEEIPVVFVTLGDGRQVSFDDRAQYDVWLRAMSQADAKSESVTLDDDEHPLLYVEWEDAEGRPAWMTEEQLLEWEKAVCVIRQVGWLVTETANHLVISPQHDTETGKRGQNLCIPASLVRRRVRLRVEAK